MTGKVQKIVWTECISGESTFWAVVLDSQWTKGERSRSPAGPSFSDTILEINRTNGKREATPTEQAAYMDAISLEGSCQQFRNSFRTLTKNPIPNWLLSPQVDCTRNQVIVGVPANKCNFITDADAVCCLAMKI